MIKDCIEMLSPTDVPLLYFSSPGLLFWFFCFYKGGDLDVIVCLKSFVMHEACTSAHTFVRLSP